MIREMLSPHPVSEQLAFGPFDNTSALDNQTEMGYGQIYSQMKRMDYNIINPRLVNKFRWVELLDVMSQTIIAFSDPTEVKQEFRRRGVKTGDGNILEMYLGTDDLLCDYRFQVNMADNATVFIKVLAYVKEATGNKRPGQHRKL